MRSTGKQSVIIIVAMAAAQWVGFGGGPAHAAAVGDIHNLGLLDGPYTSSSGYGINAAGQVSGRVSDGVLINGRAFRYDGTPGAGGVMRDLGTLGGSRSSGYGINSAGQVTGWAEAGGGAIFAFRYDGTPGAGGVMHNLGSLGGSYSEGFRINNAGQVAGTSTVNEDTVYDRAFRYDGTPGAGGVMHNLGTLGGSYSYGYGINSAGQVVGSATATPDESAPPRAFRYDGTPGSSGVMHDLGTLGGLESAAFDVNDVGQVTGFAETLDAALHAFRYDGTPGAGGVMHDLGTLGGPRSSGQGINAGGFVVGWSDRSAVAGDDQVAVLWRPDFSVIDLDAWLDDVNSASGIHWTLLSANGINDAGMIVGWGDYDDGPGGLSNGTRAFLLGASSIVVPEPGALPVLALALGVLVHRRRRPVRSRSTQRHFGGQEKLTRESKP